VTTKRANGSSTSGTPGTVVAQITAAGGSHLVGWTVFCATTSTAGTQLRLTITYADATTTTVDTVAATGHDIRANAGGALRSIAGAADAVTAFSAKEVTDVKVATLGVGTGTRYATIAGEEELSGASTIKQAGGSSASGTPATTVADIQAAAGKYLAAVSVACGQSVTASTALSLIITYIDGTSTTITTTSNSGRRLDANHGGGVTITGSAGSAVNAFSTKLITRVRVETSNTGVGTRYGVVSALEETPSRLAQMGVG